jgi:hypothetical protein
VKVTSYRELTQQQANAAVAISGAHHSSWNGQQGQTDPARKVRGVAEWNHTINYSEALVTEPAQEMFRNARAHNQDPATLQSYREAVKTMLHENVHMLAAEGSNHSQAEFEFRQPGVRPMEEGITELYSQQKLNDYIDELGLEEIAPGLKNADAIKSYPKFLPAADRFTDTIARKSGLDRADVVERMAVVTADQKFRVAADAVFDNSELPGVVPSDQREAAVRRIGSAMQQSFSEVDKVSDTEPIRRRESATAGARAADAGYREVAAIQQQWTMPAPEMQVAPRSQESQQTRSTGPAQAQETSTASAQGEQGTPSPQETGGAAVHESAAATMSPEARSTGVNGAAVAEGANGAGGAESGGDGARSVELENALRAGLGGSAPLSGASRLGDGEQGARRGGVQQGVERQGTERDA